MRRFYFDFEGAAGRGSESDDTGLELDGLIEAKQQAVRALLDFARDHPDTIAAGQPICVSIRENGASKLTLILSLTVRAG